MNEHDLVIDFIKNRLNGRFDILTNAGQSKNFHIGGIFPDVIVREKESKEILFVMEVETESSIATSVGQWKNYKILPGTFYIIVPEEKIGEVKTLVAASGVNAKFGYYIKSKNNEITRVIYE
ncbi:hypothetical protein KAJ61_00555 [Candidatus Parcubacteria bacterium]|nr:hypothetical protein [Candidatus Parcubacteria bacterium]